MSDDRLPFGSMKECPKCGGAVSANYEMVRQRASWWQDAECISNVHYVPHLDAEPYETTCPNARFVHKVWHWYRMKATGKEYYVCKSDCPKCKGEVRIRGINPERLAYLERNCGCGYSWHEKTKDDVTARTEA